MQGSVCSLKATLEFSLNEARLLKAHHPFNGHAIQKTQTWMLCSKG